jgi:AcrR family transcriptional regulator
LGRPRHDPRRAATPERVLDAAELEFGAAPFAAVRLADIARGAGITRPSLLYHFDSKEALYEAVVRRGLDALSATLLEPLPRDAAFPDRVDALVDRYALFLAERRWFARLLLREIVDGRGPGRELLVELLEPILGMVERFLSKGGRSLPMRAVVLNIGATALVREASGELRDALWGPLGAEADRTLARAMFGLP